LETVNDEEVDFQAEATYLLLSHSVTGGSSSLADSSEYQRTGRWTEQETALVDCLIHSFDKGQLPAPEGMRLNDFLRDLLLCKSSRLTKKMKHAKLSSRCYMLQHTPGFNARVISALEDEFLKSVASLPCRLELRFNFTKVWRTALSNLCVQVGSPLLIANDWMESLEVMEKKAMEAEEAIRAARRHRMGLALKTDIRSTQSGVFFSGVPVQRPETKRAKIAASSVSSDPAMHQPYPSVIVTSTDSVTCSENDDADFISTMLELETPQLGLQSKTTSFEDFSKVFGDLAHDPISGNVKNNCGPFLEAIMTLVETHNLPFEHVDVWVPSSDPSSALPGSGEFEKTLRLYHAGCATRHDLDPVLTRQLEEYGDYSTKFSFAIGSGLPGRVFQAGGHSWERCIDEADPKIFERAGGARVYGVKTGLGIGLNTSVIGRMVVALYSIRDLEEDSGVVQLCTSEFAKLSPEPKWTLVVEMGPSKHEVFPAQVSEREKLSLSSTPIVDHYHHSTPDVKFTESTHPLLSIATLAGHPLSSCADSIASHHSHGSGSVSLGPSTDPSVESQITMLLGDHMPLGEVPAASSSAPGIPTPSVADFMSLRLLFLRSPERRSEQEHELVEIIKRSYVGYSRDQRRTGKQVAWLLAADWSYLNGGRSRSFSVEAPEEVEKKPRAQSADEGSAGTAYQSFQMAPTLVTSSSGCPPRQPTLFHGGAGGFGSGRAERGSSFDNVMTDVHHQRSAALGPAHNICIVDDNSEENT
jgi:hypothetical protein